MTTTLRRFAVAAILTAVIVGGCSSHTPTRREAFVKDVQKSAPTLADVSPKTLVYGATVLCKAMTHNQRTIHPRYADTPPARRLWLIRVGHNAAEKHDLGTLFDLSVQHYCPEVL